MNDDQSDRPTGDLANELDVCGRLAAEYFAFLLDAEPLATWEEVVPLDEPIPVARRLSLDWDAIKPFSSACAPLTKVASSMKLYDYLAPILGLRYAWTRFPLHARLLNAIEAIYAEDRPPPTMILEPGCLTGGLIHFLSTVWPQAPCVGIDVSPTALDVVKYIGSQLDLPNPPAAIQADFTQIAINNMPPVLRKNVDGSLVILSNILGTFSELWSNYPALDHWNANSNLIAYWLRAGATVLLCERHDDPELLIDTVMDNVEDRELTFGAVLFDKFTSTSTKNMTIEQPLGTWFTANSCIIGFFRSDMMGAFQLNTTENG